MLKSISTPNQPTGNTNCIWIRITRFFWTRITTNYPKIIYWTRIERITRMFLWTQILDASERHYLNNTTLSDDGAQCGELWTTAMRVSRRDATLLTVLWLRVSYTLMLCRTLIPTLRLRPLPSVASLRLSVGLLRFNLSEVVKHHSNILY